MVGRERVVKWGGRVKEKVVRWGGSGEVGRESEGERGKVNEFSPLFRICCIGE